MNKTGIIIQARTGSTRLPNKILLPFYKEKSILDLIIEELKTKHQSLTIVLATSNNEKDLKLKKVAEKHNIEFFAGDEDNVLNRFIEASEKFGLTHIVRVCADNPFLKGEFINDIINTIDKYDYSSYQFKDGTPSILSHIGLFTEGTSIKALKEIQQQTKRPLYLEHVTNYLHGNSSKFNVNYFPIEKYITPNKNIRFTLDTKEDFELLKSLYPIYLEKFDKDINSLITYIENNHSILKRMMLEIDNNTK